MLMSLVGMTNNSINPNSQNSHFDWCTSTSEGSVMCACLCAFTLTLIFIAVTFLVSVQLVSIPIKNGNVAWDDNSVEARIRSVYDASTDSQSNFTARTWGACDISPGGSIYVQNKQELQLIWIPALKSIDPCSLAKKTDFMLEIQNLISEDEIPQWLIIGKKRKTFNVDKKFNSSFIIYNNRWAFWHMGLDAWEMLSPFRGNGGFVLL